MKKLRRNFIILHTAIMLLAGWAGAWMVNIDFSVDYFSLYPAIPVLFYLIGLVVILILTGEKKRTELQLVNLFLIVKVVKIAVVVIAVLLYWLVMKEGLRNFSMILISYYLLFLAVETYFFYQVEKYHKVNKKDINKNETPV